MIDDQVMGYAKNPGKEFSLIEIFALVERSDDLNKGILKDVFCKLWISYDQQNIGVNPVFVPADQLLDTGGVACYVLLHEDIIIKIM